VSLVELARYPSGAEAEIVRARLEAGGIMSFCFDSGTNIAEGVGLLIPVRVMVIPEDLEEAREILGEGGEVN
jgi:hypothetical protein